MKTLTLFFLIVFTTLCTVNAQITKGNWMVGGSGNFSSTKSENSSGSEAKGTLFEIKPNIGYFVIDKLATGINSSIGFGNPSGSNNNSWGYSIGPFIRYYFLEIDKKINLLSQVDYSIGQGKSDFSSLDTNSSNLSIKAGPVIYFNSSVGLELLLNYDYSKSKRGSSETIGNQFNISIGFQIHLEKK